MAYLDSAPSTDPGPDNGKEGKEPSARLRKYWREIEAYNKASEDWTEQANKIVKLYLDQHKTASSPRRFALLWSNIETLKPSVYAKLPTVLCSRRYKDPHPVGRTAAELLERATNATFDLYRADEVFRMVRDDRLLAARGQAWVRYEADLNGDKIKSERVCIDYVHWCDFGHNVAGVWKDVWLTWRKVYKNREDVEERFGEDIAEKLTYQKRVDGDSKEMSGGELLACIYEMWDKKRRKTVFVSRDCNEIMEEGDPPLNFRDFFPCPEPCYGSKTGKSLIPTPDYRYYQDQANEIDDLTEKIANLTDFLIMRGFVPAGPSADGADAVRIMIQSLQSSMTSNKNVFVPVESWVGFTEKGGAAKLIDWLPVEKVMQALQSAVDTRQQLIQDVYQITGISDILRGQTDAQETLGAQQLKAETGSRRISNAKDEVARFCRDVGQLVAEVIAEVFQPQTIADMTGFAYDPMGQAVDPAQQGMPQPQQPMQPPGIPPMPGQPPQMGAPPLQPGMPQPGMPQAMPMPGQPQSPSKQTFNDEVIQLLRNDRMRGFLIDIETDSTIQPDEDAEKQRRTEFVTGVGSFLKEAALIIPGAPSLVPMVSEMLLFLVRGFRAGRNLEEVIERSMNQLSAQMMQPKPPDPKVAAEQAKAQAAQQQAAIDQQAAQQKMQGDVAMMQQKQQAEAEKNRMEMVTMQAELQFLQQKLGIQRQEAQIRLSTVQQEAAIKSDTMQQQQAADANRLAMEGDAAERQHELGAEAMQTKHDMGLEMMAEKARQQKQNGAVA